MSSGSNIDDGGAYEEQQPQTVEQILDHMRRTIARYHPPTKHFLASLSTSSDLLEGDRGMEAALEHTRAMILASTQSFLEINFGSRVQSIESESGHKKVVLHNVGNLQYAVVSTMETNDQVDEDEALESVKRLSDQEVVRRWRLFKHKKMETAGALRRQLELFHRLLRFRVQELGPNVNPYSARIPSDIAPRIKPLLHTMESMWQRHQFVLVRAVEVLDCGKINRAMIAEAIESACLDRSVPPFNQEQLTIHHAVLLVRTKCVAIYSHKKTFTLMPSDLFNLVLFAQNAFNVDGMEPTEEERSLDEEVNDEKDGSQNDGLDVEDSDGDPESPHPSATSQTTEHDIDMEFEGLSLTRDRQSGVGSTGDNDGGDDDDELEMQMERDADGDAVDISPASSISEKGDGDYSAHSGAFPEFSVEGSPLITDDDYFENAESENEFHDTGEETKADASTTPEKANESGADHDNNGQDGGGADDDDAIPPRLYIFDHVVLHTTPNEQADRLHKFSIYAEHDPVHNTTLILICDPVSHNSPATPASPVRPRPLNGVNFRDSPSFADSTTPVGPQEFCMEVASRVQDTLRSFNSFLRIKEQAHMTMRHYLHHCPGLIHFIFVDRVRGIMVAPRIIPLDNKDADEDDGNSGNAGNQQGAEGESGQDDGYTSQNQNAPFGVDMQVEFLRDKIWEMVHLMMDYQGKYTEVCVCNDTVQYWYQEWAEEEHGTQIKIIPQNFKHIRAHYELYTMYLPFVSSAAVAVHNRTLVSLLLDQIDKD